MTILRTDKIAGLESVNAINGSVNFETGRNKPIFLKIASDDFAVGTGDFTLECWYYKSGLGTHDDAVGNIIMETGNTPNGQNGIWLADAQGKLEGRVHYGSGSWNLDITSSSSMSNDTWYHVAISRSGSTVRIFIDGALEASGSSSSDLTTAYSNEAYVGGQGNSPGNRGIIGFISNARISNTALYTGAFTVPTRQLEVTPETLLLCCQSPVNVLQEATGKTIVTYVDSTNNKGPSPSTFVPDVGNDHTHGTVLEGNVEFPSLNYMTLPRGTTTQSNRGRGLLAGSNDGSPFSDNIQYINIQSQGNSVDFGNLTVARSRASSYASSTRGIWGGGQSSPTNKDDTIDYVTIATTANAIDFGNLTVARKVCVGTSSATRGLSVGGNEAPPSPYPSVNVIDYTTIASAGNATDFGDLLGARSGQAALSSPTRALFAGGYAFGWNAAATNDITYVEIATTGNSVDFGDLTVTKRYGAGCSNNTRGVFGCGSNPGMNNTIDYVTIATTGNAVDFGDSIVNNNHYAGISNSIRGVWAGLGTPAIGNAIDFIIIATTGNSQDFGDTATNMGYTAGCSDSHGGLTE